MKNCPKRIDLWVLADPWRGFVGCERLPPSEVDRALTGFFSSRADFFK